MKKTIVIITTILCVAALTSCHPTGRTYYQHELEKIDHRQNRELARKEAVAIGNEIASQPEDVRMHHLLIIAEMNEEVLPYRNLETARRLMDYYETLISKTESFFEDEFKARVKQEAQYQKIRDSYEYFEKRGLTDLGYVNLYDIKKSFRLSFETFNELLNSYYTQNRQKEIILFSNTVASIDQRRRFVVDGIAALKIRIIKKS